MKRILFLVVILFLLVAGGGLTSQFASGTMSSGLPLGKEQVADPEASVFQATSWQAQQFMLLVGFLLFNLVGIGLTIAVIMWFLNRQVNSVKATGAVTGKDIEPAKSDLA